MDFHGTPRARSRKMMEDSLRSRVNDAREALVGAKECFVSACLAESDDPELQSERRMVAARMQTLAMETLLTALIEFNTFIFGQAVPEQLPPQSAGLAAPGCGVRGADLRKGPGSELSRQEVDRGIGELQHL